MKRDPITVRRVLLQALTDTGAIASPTLGAFKEAGFLFDHAIRCQLPMEQIETERKLAARYEGQLVSRSRHLLRPVEDAKIVWVMGRVARNAVANVFPTLPRERRKLTPPYRIEGMGKFVVSKYFTRFDKPDAARQIARLALEE